MSLQEGIKQRLEAIHQLYLLPPFVVYILQGIGRLEKYCALANVVSVLALLLSYMTFRQEGLPVDQAGFLSDMVSFLVVAFTLAFLIWESYKVLAAKRICMVWMIVDLCVFQYYEPEVCLHNAAGFLRMRSVRVAMLVLVASTLLKRIVFWALKFAKNKDYLNSLVFLLRFILALSCIEADFTMVAIGSCIFYHTNAMLAATFIVTCLYMMDVELV